MYRNLQIKNAVRAAIACGVATGFVFAAPAMADQSQPASQSAPNAAPPATNNAAASTKLKAVEVTGTMIKRTSVEQAQPIQVITAAQIRSSGLTTVGQVLQNITASGSAINTLSNNAGNFQYIGGGQTNLDLRYLGAQRTLVLVNGHRWSQSINGTVDLNTIPSAIIDHIEILQDGASAIYGSDAISGVVNIITVKNLNGAEAHAYTGSYHGDGHWDGQTQSADVTVGTSTDRSGVVFNLSYSNQDAISAGNHPMTAVPVWGTGLTRGSSSSAQGRFRFIPTPGGSSTDPDNFPAASTMLTSAQCPAKNFGTASAPNYLPFCDLQVTPGTPGTSPSDFEHWVASDAYNYSPYNYVLTPEQRFSVYSAGHYDIADNLTLTFTGTASRRFSRQQAGPTPLGVGSSSSVTFNPGQKYYPFNFKLSTTAPVGPGLLEGIGRRMVEDGPRRYSETESLVYANVGLNGYFDVGSSEWDWDVGGAFSKDDLESRNNGHFNIQRFALQFDIPACAAQAALAESNSQVIGNICRPLNLFGGQTAKITPDQLAFSTYTNQNQLGSNMQNVYADISNSDLATLPGGPLGFAAGYQHLAQSSFFQPDALAVEGIDSYGSLSIQPTSGSTSSDAAYVEFDLPLLANVPMAKLVDLDVASRYTRNYTLGVTEHNTSSRAGLKWQPNANWLLRGSWSQGFRAPNISELFAGFSTLDITGTDPCSNYLNSGVSAETQQRCAAAGVPPSYSQEGPQLGSEEFGNVNLKPETSISKTVGFVYSPSWLVGFNMNLDYYNIQVNNAIQPLQGTTILNNCYVSGVQSACDKITRNSNGLGGIKQLLDPVTNIGGTITSGFDFGFTYVLPTTAIGQFKVGLEGTYINRYDQLYPSPTGEGFLVTSLLGVERGGTTFPFGMPRWKANANVNWTSGNWTVNWKIQYIGSLTEACSDFLDGTPNSFANLGVCSNPNLQNNSLSTNYLGQTVYHDASVSYEVEPWNTRFTFGINNLFDKMPPESTQVELNSFDPTLYRVPERFFYARVGVKF